MIYEHFNRTLDKHIDRMGRAKVEQMVKELTALEEEFSAKCNVSLAVNDGEVFNDGQHSLPCMFLSQPDDWISRMMPVLQMSDDNTNLTRFVAHRSNKIGFQREKSKILK